MIENCKSYIRKQRALMALKIAMGLMALIGLSFGVSLNPLRFVQGLPSMLDLVKRMLSPNWSYVTSVMPVMVETLQMAFIASCMGSVIAIPLALLSSSNVAPSQKLSSLLNACFALLRTIPSLVWAILLVSIFGLGKFSGILALAMTSILMSQRLLRESIEGVNDNQLNAGISVGASIIQVLRYSVFPIILPAIVSTFFMTLETNMRHATVLGFVGAGGIGQLMWRDLNHLRYDNIATLVFMLFICVLMIDTMSFLIRRYSSKPRQMYQSVKGHFCYSLFKMMLVISGSVMLYMLLRQALSISPERFMLGLEQSGQMLSRMLRLDVSYWPQVFIGLLESLVIALFATCVGGIVTLLVTYVTAYNASPNRYVSFLMKACVNALRTFPPIVLAIIFFRGVGPGPMAGALALSVYTVGVLTKLYAETIEHVPVNLENSLRVTGASSVSMYVHGLYPHTRAHFFSLMLYRLESNMRASTILGIIGAGGIGSLLSTHIAWRNWERVGMILVAMTLMIIAIDFISSILRKRLK